MYGINGTAQKYAEIFELLGFKIEGYLCDKDEMESEEYQREHVACIEDLKCENDTMIFVANDNIEKSISYLETMGLNHLRNYISVDSFPIQFTSQLQMVLDMNLGYTSMGTNGYTGFEILGNNKEGDFKIAILGNSTTDSALFPFDSWPHFLYQKCARKDLTIYNGGVSGYSSTQELFKLIRDVSVLKPDMLIVYDGACNMVYDPGKLFEMGALREVFKYANSNMQSFGSISLGVDHMIYAGGVSKKRDGKFESWLSDIELMYAAARQNGISFFAFLQPVLTSKKKRNSSECDVLRAGTHGDIADFHKEAQERMLEKTHRYITDLSDIFDKESDIYIDELHVTEKGNRIIAEKIYQKIEACLP